VAISRRAESPAAAAAPGGGPFVRLVARTGITPNGITLLGFAGICVAAGLAGARQWVAASLVFIASGLVDSLDGQLARYQGRVTRFGGFLDSTLDRLAEAVILGAVGITFAADGREWALGAAFAALSGSFLVSYARARAEGLGIAGSSAGLMGRPERLVLLGGALFLGGVGLVLEVVVTVLAVLSLATAGQRVLLVRRTADPPPPPRRPE
jgi:CDP-diacylglycerol---glycerol-3-phosphate 3-phosphatidyltransferase